MPRPPTYFVSRENASPEPWLLSTNGELEREAMKRKTYSDAWLQAHPFPGAQADKLPWLTALEKKYQAQLEEDFYMTDAPKTPDVVKNILMDNAPDSIFVELRVPRAHLVNLQDKWTPTKFTVPETMDYQGERTWKAYCQFLLESTKDKHIVFGYQECRKQDEISTVLRAFAESTGVDALRMRCMLDDETRKISYEWGIQERVGENLYLFRNGRFVVPLDLLLFVPSAAEMANKAFELDLKVIKDQMKAKGDPKVYLLVDKSMNAKEESGDESEEELLSADTHYVMWLPAEYEKIRDRIHNHFQWGEGESNHIQMRLDKGNTDTGNLKVAMFERTLNYIKYDLKNIREKFCSALALLMTATYDSYWMVDNECWEEFPDMVKDLATFFRTNLLKKSDVELGLGLDDVDKENPDDMSESRQALYTLLEYRAKQFHSGDGNGTIKFNWKPGKPRKLATANHPNVTATAVDKQAKTA